MRGAAAMIIPARRRRNFLFIMMRMANDILQHSVVRFDREIEEVKGLVLQTGGALEQRLSGVLTALVEGDGKLLDWVADSDRDVNILELEVDEKCIGILARRQPMARDLRLIIAIMKIITDLERIGDESRRIAQLMKDSALDSIPKSMSRTVRHLGSSIVEMLHDVMDAFARLDPELSRQVLARDNDVDEEYTAVLRQLMTYLMQEPRYLSHVMNIIWCSRSFERIGDHIKNIAEYTIYMVEARDVGHGKL